MNVKAKNRSLISGEKLQQLYLAMLKRRDPGEHTPLSQKRRNFSAAGCTINLRREDVVLSVQSIPIANSTSGVTLSAAARAASRIKKTGNVVVAVSDVSSQNEWRGVFSLAGIKSLPIVFIDCGGLCAGDRSAKTPAKQKDIGLLAEDTGFPSIPVDGHDLAAVYRVTHESVLRARRGGGPTLIECKSYRIV